MKDTKKEPKPVESLRLLKFLSYNLNILGALQAVKLSLYSQFLHGSGSSRRYWGTFLPIKDTEKKVNPKI